MHWPCTHDSITGCLAWDFVKTSVSSLDKLDFDLDQGQVLMCIKDRLLLLGCALWIDICRNLTHRCVQAGSDHRWSHRHWACVFHHLHVIIKVVGPMHVHICIDLQPFLISFCIECITALDFDFALSWRGISIRFQTQRRAKGGPSWKDLPNPKPRHGKLCRMWETSMPSRRSVWIGWLGNGKSATFWWLQTMPWWSYFKQIIFCQIGVARSARVAKEVSCLDFKQRPVKGCQSTAATIMVATRGSIRTICIPSSRKHVVAATHLSKLKVLCFSCCSTGFQMLPFTASCTPTTKSLRTWRSAWCSSGRLG